MVRISDETVARSLVVSQSRVVKLEVNKTINAKEPHCRKSATTIQRIILTTFIGSLIKKTKIFSKHELLDQHINAMVYARRAAAVSSFFV